MANLARACRDAQFPGRIGLVLSNRDHAPGVALARELGLPVETLSHGDFASREAFDEALSARLDARGIQLVVLAGFMRIPPHTFVRRPEGRMVNIPPSLLPPFPVL